MTRSIRYLVLSLAFISLLLFFPLAFAANSEFINEVPTAGGGGGGGDVATDAIYDTAGDLPVGTGANTAVAVNIPVQRIVGRLTGENVKGLTAAEVNTLLSLPQTTVSGNAGTATALAADPANCSAGQIALGITAAGVAECTATPSGLTSVGATTFTGALTGAASGNAPLNPVATDTIFDVKGDLAVGTGADTAARLAAAADYSVLYTLAGEATGLKWLVTANSGIWITSAGGVPSIGTDIPTAVTIGGGYVYRTGGTDVNVANGGTGVSTLALNGILFGNAANAVGVTAIGAEGQVLRVGASPFVPAFSTSTFADTYAQYSILYAGTANTITGLTSSADMISLLGSADYATARINLGLAISTDVQAYYAALEAWGAHAVVNNGLLGYSSAGVADIFTTHQHDDSAAQFGSATASKGTLKVLLNGSTDGKLMTVASAQTDNRTVTLPDATGTVALTTGTVERIGATFDGGGSAIAVNKIAYVHVPYALTTINQWTVVCDVDSGATGIIITPYMDAYAADTLPTTTMCTTGTPPHTTDGAGAGGLVHQANWDCNITAIPADRIIGFKVTTAPTSATWCSVSLKVTR